MANASGRASLVGNEVSGCAKKPYAGSRGSENEETAGTDSAAGAGREGVRKAEWGGTRSAPAYAPHENAFRNKAELLERELRVGQGPSSLGPVRVKPEALERIRLRDAVRGGSRSG